MITIALVTYNRPLYLREAISAILAQTYDDFELLICDNGSDNTTKEVIDTFSDSRIKHIRNEKNDIEFYNYPFWIKTRKYLLITHDDDIMHINFLKTLLPKIEEMNLTALSCNALTIDEKSNLTGNSLLNLRKELVILKDNYIRHYFLGEVPPCPTVVMRKAFFDSFHIKMNFSVGRAADQYMWYQVVKNGGAIGILNEPLYSYRVHTQQDSFVYQNVMEWDLFIAWIRELPSDQTWERKRISERMLGLFYANAANGEFRKKGLTFFKNAKRVKSFPGSLFIEIKLLSFLGNVRFFRILLLRIFKVINRH